MAEEEKKSEKKSKGQSRYGHPPKIKDKAKKEPGDAPVDKTEPEKASAGSEPKPSVDAGTDGISIQDRHKNEREEMSARHAKEVHQMHGRHASEHEAMIQKHAGDMQTADIMGASPGMAGAGAPAPAAPGAPA